MSASVTFATTDPRLPEARALLAASDAYMGALYPSESNHLDSADALVAAEAHFMGCWVDGAMVGCGAVKLREDGEGAYGEIKRVFVKPSFRGRGLSRALMAELERHLVALRVPRARLETGIHQVEALTLYRTMGYRERGPFGQYRDDPLSVFMEKTLLA